MAWSLETEICALANTTDFKDALLKLKIIEHADSKFSLRHDADWMLGGAETYIYRFWIESARQLESGYILKACTAFSPVKDLNEILNDWIKRRLLLSQWGISTPILYGYANGVILEELVPFSLAGLLCSEFEKTSNGLDPRLIQLCDYAAALYSLGFLAIAPFDDLHSRGNDLVVIDFGQDLGPAQGKPVSSKAEVFEAMLKVLKKWGVRISDPTKNSMYEVYTQCIDLKFSTSSH